MAQRIPTRLGDGSLVELTRAEVEVDLLAGTQAAVKRAKVEPLTQDELDHLLDIFTSPAKFSAVDYGDEVVLSFDGSGNADACLAPFREQGFKFAAQEAQRPGSAQRERCFPV